MPSLARFTIDDLEVLSRSLRVIGDDAEGMPEAAALVAGHLSDQLTREDGAPACAAVTVHKTHAFGDLPDALQAEARKVDGTVTSATTCLALLAATHEADVVGDPEPVVPLTDEVFRARPVFDAVLDQVGLDRTLATQPATLLESGVHRSELGAYLAADVASLRDVGLCVAGRDVRSMVTFGGGLPTGDLFFVSLFGTEVVGSRATNLLRTLAPAIKATLIPHALHPWPGT